MNYLHKTGKSISLTLQKMVPRKSSRENREVSTFATGLKVSYETEKSGLRKFHKEVIRQCFGKNDVGSVKEMFAEVQTGEGVVLLVTEGKEVLGGVVVSHYWSTGKKVMLISWLAVKLNHRGRNIGTLLVQEAMSYARNNGALLLLGQVEDPELVSVGDHLAHGNPNRRVQFYSRFDCKRMEVPCYVPAFHEYEEPLFNIMLTLFPLSVEQTEATEIQLPELAVFVDELVCKDTKQESRNFVNACKAPVALTPFKELY